MELAVGSYQFVGGTEPCLLKSPSQEQPRVCLAIPTICATLVFLTFAQAAAAQTAEPLHWGVDPQGVVTAAARLDNTLYVGGNFFRIYQTTGGGALVDQVSGAILGTTPAVAGSI